MDNLGAIILQIERLAPSECEELLGLCAKLPEFERRTLSRAAARRWASLDPEGVFASLPQYRGTENWSVLVEAAARELVHRDPQSVVAKLESPDPRDRNFMRRILLTELAKADPWRAAEVASGNRDFIRDNDLYQIVARELAKESPEQALRWAGALWQPYARLPATHEVWKTWAMQDPAAAAAEFSRNRPNARESGDLIRMLAGSWSRKDESAAAAWIQTLSREEREQAWSAFQPEVTAENGSELLALLESIDSEKSRRTVASVAAGKLALKDHSAALEWARNLPESDQPEIMEGIVGVWALKDPRGASDYIFGLPESDSRQQMIRNLLGYWAPLEPEAALAWASRLSSAEEREVAAVRSVVELQHYTPEIATEWLALVNDSAKRADLAREIASRWAQVDGTAAARWVQSSADSHHHPEAYYAVARQWAFAEPDATAQWITSLPEGTIRDSAIGAFVTSIDGYDPARATEWAASIQNPEDRAHKTAGAFRRWMQKDPDGAFAWLEETALPESTRAELAALHAGNRAEP